MTHGKQNVAGSFYHYIFKFNVIDEESAPYVNYHELSETQQLEDLQSKHYEVVYKTNRGGYVYVCFSIDSYDDALKYAREIEGRYVETVSGNEGGWYYKSEKNPNRKVKYYDEIELTKIREYYAKKNIEINYFNPLDEFTYRTYDNNLLDCLEDLNISDSIKVFPSHEEKNKLTDRAPYLNNFKFIQASKYDVVNVRVKNTSTDEMTDIKFGVSVDKQLKETSKYRIIETNLYGRSKEYDAIYMNECQTRSRWVVEKDNQKRIVDITPDMVSNNSIISIDADSVYVSEIYNIYDKWAIVTIKAPKVYSSEIKCLAAEFKNIELNKGGTYEISFIDRIGNSYKMNLNISGNKEYSNKNDFTSSYTELYNKIYMNNMDEREDYTELPLLVSDNETIGSDDMYNTNDAYETNEKNVEDKANKSKNDEGNHNEKKRNPVVIVFVVIAALIFVFVLKKGKTAKNEEVHKDEKNK